MVRKSCFILGIALGIFWWIGLSQNQAATLLWFDAVAAVLAFGTAALRVRPRAQPEPRSPVPMLLGSGLGRPLGRRHVDRPAGLGQLAELRCSRWPSWGWRPRRCQPRMVHARHRDMRRRGRKPDRCAVRSSDGSPVARHPADRGAALLRPRPRADAALLRRQARLRRARAPAAPSSSARGGSARPPSGPATRSSSSTSRSARAGAPGATCASTPRGSARSCSTSRTSTAPSALLDERGGTFITDVQRFSDDGGTLAMFSITTPFGDTTFRFVERRGYTRALPGLRAGDRGAARAAPATASASSASTT